MFRKVRIISSVRKGKGQPEQKRPPWNSLVRDLVQIPLETFWPGIYHGRLAEHGLLALRLMNMPANDQQRPQTQDGIADRAAAQVLAARGDIDRSPGRRVTDQHAAGRAAGQQRGGLLLGEIVTPGTERRDRDAAADAEELDAGDADARAVQYVGARPSFTHLGQFLRGLIIPGDEDGRLVNRPQHLDAVAQVAAHGPEITGADDRRAAPVSVCRSLKSSNFMVLAPTARNWIPLRLQVENHIPKPADVMTLPVTERRKERCRRV